MRWLALFLIVITPGCIGGGTYGAPAMEAPTLVILDGDDLDPDAFAEDEMSNPESICLRVTNNSDQSWTTGHGSFYVLDANRTLHSSDLTATYWGREPFPSYQEFPPDTSLQGCISFEIEAERDPAPYTLVYQYPAGTVEAKLPAKSEA